MGQQSWVKESGERNLMNQIAASAMAKRGEIYCFAKEKKVWMSGATILSVQNQETSRFLNPEKSRKGARASDLSDTGSSRRKEKRPFMMCNAEMSQKRRHKSATEGKSEPNSTKREQFRDAKQWGLGSTWKKVGEARKKSRRRDRGGETMRKGKYRPGRAEKEGEFSQNWG